MPTLDLIWRDVPPSLNRAGRSHWRVQHRIKTELQSTLEGLLMASGLPRGQERIEAWATLRFPTRGRRDEGNFRWMLEKALGDALTNGRWLADDSTEQFRFYLIKIERELGPKQSVITLRYAEPAPLVEV